MFRPPPALTDHVAVLWAGWWDLTGQEPHTTRLLSDPCANIVFEEGAAPRLVGTWTSIWTRTLEGRGRVRAAKLAAGAVRAFVDADAHALADRIVPLADVMDVPAGLAADVLAPGDPHDGCQALAAWLAGCLRGNDADMTLALRACAVVAADPSLCSVTDLGRAVGASPRTLQRVFRRHVGGSPKWVIRRYRLQEAAQRIERGDAVNLATVAAELGYADQAHLTRDFTAAVGVPPSRFGRDVHETPGSPPR